MRYDLHDMSIIDGKQIAQTIKDKIKAEIKEENLKPGLAVILVGNSQASQIYVKHKKLACKEVGIKSFVYELEEGTTKYELLELIEKLNKDNKVHGILVQLPLPDHINKQIVLEAIDPKKDVDGFHPINAGKLMLEQDGFIPATPAGIIELIKQSGYEIFGRNAVVVGRSNIVGKPVAQLLLNEHATVTVCHTKTKNLKEICHGADILIAAAGKANLITQEMVKEGAIVIDVGMNRNEKGKLCGDVDFEKVKNIVGAITPVPGGVGPMTIAMLLRNTLKAANIN
jgi:methylenetetrahydrofolate dehydrogenase (NADP+)/methenyltetrahydrofolate cyclohydrolase